MQGKNYTMKISASTLKERTFRYESCLFFALVEDVFFARETDVVELSETKVRDEVNENSRTKKWNLGQSQYLRLAYDGSFRNRAFRYVKMVKKRFWKRSFDEELPNPSTTAFRYIKALSKPQLMKSLRQYKIFLLDLQRQRLKERRQRKALRRKI